jgi:hypothetical protein
MLLRSSLKHGPTFPLLLWWILFTVAEWQPSLMDYGSVCVTDTVSSTLTVTREQAARVSSPLSAGSTMRWMRSRLELHLFRFRMPSIFLAAVIAIVSSLLGTPTLSVLEWPRQSFMVGGMLLMSIGVLGEYLGCLCGEVRVRPLSIISSVFDATGGTWGIEGATYAELVPMKVAYTPPWPCGSPSRDAVVLSARRRHRLNG